MTPRSLRKAIANTLFNAEIVVLESKRDEVEEISITLEEYPYTETLHIICNTSPGCLYLGNTCLNLFNFKDYSIKLKHWCTKNILLYGSSNIAAGNAGRKFIQKLYQITGSNLAVYSQLSTDEMNWHCDYSLGNINPDLNILPFVKKNTLVYYTAIDY